jgi:putative membrane protein
VASPSTLPEGADRFEVRVTADSHFGWIRTRLSLERTLMSWMRTGTALIGFGFAIVQYLDRLQQIPGANPAYLPTAPRYLGLSMIAAGVLGLLISIWQYHWTLRYLWQGSFASIAGMKQEGMQSTALGVAVLLVGVGLFAFFAMPLRLG